MAGTGLERAPDGVAKQILDRVNGMNVATSLKALAVTASCSRARRSSTRSRARLVLLRDGRPPIYDVTAVAASGRATVADAGAFLVSLTWYFLFFLAWRACALPFDRRPRARTGLAAVRH